MVTHNKIGAAFLTLLAVMVLMSCFVKIDYWYFLLVILIWFLLALVGSAFIGSNYHVKAYCNNPNETQNHIALTFDDGPHEMTIPILDLLKKHQVQATFFCIGKNIEKHPEILKRIIKEGHLVGNHSYSHSHFFDFYRKDEVLKELKKTNELIEKVTGKKVCFFRPPYGVTNPSIRRALAIFPLNVIGWNIRSLDAVIKNEKIVLKRIVKRIVPGGIVLLHDTSQNTVAVLEKILNTLNQKKYQVVSLEQLLNLKAYED